MNERETIRKQQAELITKAAADSEMGQLLRRYWQPVALSRKLQPGSPPQAIRILGEELVLFRNDEGRPGLLNRKCAHRCADLSLGRIENGGLRCLYHGWLFDIGGNCLQQPTESAETQTCDKVKQTAYPCYETGGAIWAYFGPGDPPVFPRFPALMAPEEHVVTHQWYTKSNFLQGNEGNLDPSHTSYLHGYVEKGEKAPWTDAFNCFKVDPAPNLFVEDTCFGVRIYAERDSEEENKKVLRTSNFIMPNAAAANGFETGFGIGGCAMVWHVPIDDVQHWRFEFTFHCKVSREEGLDEIDRIFNSEFTEDGMPLRKNENGFIQDREEMKSNSFSGVGPCFPLHDIFIVESQGEIHDRTQEHLVHSDVAIVRARQQIREGLQDIKEGKDPRGIARNTDDSLFPDFLVVTKSLDRDTDSKEHCYQLEKEDIYRLDTSG